MITELNIAKLGHMKLTDFKSGDQVAFIPDEANRDINHPNVEFGFVTSVSSHFVFCRFWWTARQCEIHPTLALKDHLRTLQNSEPCSPESLIMHKHRLASTIIDVMNDLYPDWRKNHVVAQSNSIE